jgi:hypothetical protein
VAQSDSSRWDFQALLFGKIVPNCKRLELFDAGHGWLSERFTETGVIAFEVLEDLESRLDVEAEQSPTLRKLLEHTES